MQVTFSWSAVTLGTYAAVNALARAEVTDTMQQDVSLLSMLTGKDEEYFMDLPLKNLGDLRMEMHRFLSTDPKENYTPTFECNGRRYKVSETLEEFTGAQYEGVTAQQADSEKYPSKAHIITAILCKEIPTEINVWVHKAGWRFWQKDRFQTVTVEPLNIHERAAQFEKYLPASIALGINSFFFLYSQELYPLVLEKMNKDTLKLKAMMERKSNRQNSGRRK